MCRENGRLRAAIAASRKGQRLIVEGAAVGDVDLNRFDEVAKVVVSSKRTFEAAVAYAGRMRTCAHNFASSTNPGGGVVNGSSAQEEALCRCSTLYFNLNVREMWDGFYTPHREAHDPLHNDDIIYTPGVVVFKSDTAYPRTLAESEWKMLDVITCAAAAMTAIADYLHAFRLIEFAVYCRPGDTANYDAFAASGPFPS